MLGFVDTLWDEGLDRIRSNRGNRRSRANPLARLERDQTRKREEPELLLFAHPFCSCTVATMAELAKIQVRRKPGTIAPIVTVLFYRPRNSGWGPNDLWNKANSIENVHAILDDDGRESRRFGAHTSGYALLYSAEGELLFGGGVTGSRGHEGDNDGLDLLEASLDSRRPSGITSRVFGCALGSWNEGKDGNR